jgi:hypothetical protein
VLFQVRNMASHTEHRKMKTVNAADRTWTCEPSADAAQYLVALSTAWLPWSALHTALVHVTLSFVHSLTYSVILQTVVRQVHSIFQSDFSTECDLVLPLSISLPCTKFQFQAIYNVQNLRQLRPDDNYHSDMNCRIPFTNAVVRRRVLTRATGSKFQWTLKYHNETICMRVFSSEMYSTVRKVLWPQAQMWSGWNSGSATKIN